MVIVHDVYQITQEQKDTATGEVKSKWVKIGVAFENKDDSLNVILDCVPLNGKLHIRKREEQEIK